MEASAKSGHDLNAVNTGIESTLHRLVHLCRRRNLFASPLLCLPTELILKIFVCAAIEIESDDNRPVLVLTAICHKLREIAVASPELWGTVDLITPPIAELFLERCKYDPHTLRRSSTTSERRSKAKYLVGDPRRDALWEKLKDYTFDGLQSIIFEGTQHEFVIGVAGILRKAPNVSNLEIINIRSRPGLSWPVNDPLSNLSTLRVHKFWISWDSPLLRNLTQLVMSLSPFSRPSVPTSIEMFLTALANCPNLEILNLTHVGPDSLDGLQDNCDMVVQLRRLQDLRLGFSDPSRIGYILSHIECPESAQLVVQVTAEIHYDLLETISKILPHRNIQTSQHFRKSEAIAICSGYRHFHFSTHNLLVNFEEPSGNFAYRVTHHVLAQLASKILEVIGGDTTTSLHIGSWRIDPPHEMWRVLLHGLPRLERVCYHLRGVEEDREFVNPLIFVFSLPFEGEPVCPRLQHLEIPKRILTQDTSAVWLERILTERDASGRRLRRIGLSGNATEGDWLVLEPFRHLVDEVR